MTEVDTEQRGRASAHQLGRSQDGAVAAQDDDELELARLHVVAEHGHLVEAGIGGQEVAALVVAEHRDDARRDELPAQTRTPAIEGVLTTGVRDDEDVPRRVHP